MSPARSGTAGRRAALAVCAVLAFASAAFVRASDRLDTVWLESFDAAWRIVNETYYDPKFNGLDWQAVREELRPRV
jgi:carboxyl-terminal processing protease